jgi:hypothetical protein
MNGYNNLMLPFRLNFREVVENKEAVLNGLSAIQRFFDGNIWLPLGANVETLFVRGVVGATEDLCDWFEVPASWPPFEPEKWEEKEHLWYVLGSGFSYFFKYLSLLYLFFCFFFVFFCWFFCLFFFVVKRPQEGFRRYREVFSVVHSRILWWLESWQDVFHPSPGIFRFPLVRQEDAPFLELLFCSTGASGLARGIRILG